jgi:HD-GYP domain-containing protein (c-di-GMP phosphodiesterase class II)
MSCTATPFERTLSPSAHAFGQTRRTPLTSGSARSAVGATAASGSGADSGLPLVDVAGAVTAAVRGLVPSCASAILIRIHGCWQILAQSGSADVALHHQRHLASLDLGAAGVIRTDRHLVAKLASEQVAACLLLVALPGREVPERAHELVRAMLECAGSKLDGAATLQRRDRALRRRELLDRESSHQPRSVTDLEEAVASLWPRCAARYIAQDALAGLDHATRRLVKSACSTGVATEMDEPDNTTLLRSDWVHRIAVPVGSRGALLIEPAAAGEGLDGESVAAAKAAARIWSLVEKHEDLQAELRSLRREDPETGCMVGSSLERRLDNALQASDEGGRVSLLVLQIGQLNAGTDIALASRLGRLLNAVVSDDDAEIFRVRAWRYALIVRGGSLRDARRLAQRLRLAVRQVEDAACTASVGIALAPTHGLRPCELLDAAEHAMNLAAAEGGDGEQVATQPGRGRVVEADIYRKLDALRTLKAIADQVCHGGLAHADAVAQRATRIALQMGLDRRMVLAIQLAGEFHEVGSLFVGPGEVEDRPNALRALLASRLLKAAGLETAAEVVAAMHERVDGAGVPNRQPAEEIPIGARILAVANAIETILDGLGRGDRGLDTAIRHVKDEAGRAFDRRVVAIALAHASESRSVPMPSARELLAVPQSRSKSCLVA